MVYQVSENDFTHKVETARNRANALQQRVSEGRWQEPDALAISLEELQTALEELRVADEELRQQNEELMLTRAVAEVQRQRYQELFDFAPDGYLVTDNSGVIQEANQAAAKLLGILQRHLVGKPVAVFIPDADRSAFRSRLNQLQKQIVVQEWEIVMRSRDGNTFDASLTIAPICNRNTQTIGLRWMLRDITARKQAEEKSRLYQLENLQLQEATKLKSQFLALMSHELRTPMNAILGFSQLLLRQANAHHLPPNCINLAERILQSGKHLLLLIEDILDFSKLEAGRLELRVEEFNLVELVNRTVEELQILFQQKQLTVEIQCLLDHPHIVNDPYRVRQILVNLLSNAIKFTHTGSVCVKVEEVLPNKVAIAVKDTGIGIAEEDLNYIFQEFRQVNQIMTRTCGGTGLGLAISDRLVKMMQGRIIVDSQLGEGSTFRVELPRQVRG
jgi:PAS domain S-box-containing protein